MELSSLSRNASLCNACEDRTLDKIYVCLILTWWKPHGNDPVNTQQYAIFDAV